MKRNTANAIIVTAISILVTSIVSNAQYTPHSQGDVDMIKSAKLSVVMKDVDEKKLKKESKHPAEAEAYKKTIETYNESIKQIVKTEWPFANEITYISEGEALKIEESRDEHYCFLETGSYLCRDIMGGVSMGRVPTLQIRSAAHPKSPLVMCVIPEPQEQKGVLTYCMQQLVNQLQDYEKGVGDLGALKKFIAKKTPLLKNKTLLLSREIMMNADKLDANGKLKEKYPFPYEVVSYEKLMQVILEKDERYAYAWYTPDFATEHQGTIFQYLIIDAKDGHPMFFTQKAGMAMGVSFGFFSVNQLERATKEATKE